MLFNIKPPDTCQDCIFCEEQNFCRLLCGRHIRRENKPSFCPFVTDENDAFLCDGVTKLAHAFNPEGLELKHADVPLYLIGGRDGMYFEPISKTKE